MPTYDYRCPTCAYEESVVQSISEYCREPKRPVCPECADKWREKAKTLQRPGYDLLIVHECMERKLSVNPAMSGLANALAGDRHYDGLRATDGSPIDTRAKHRQYMKDKNLTMASDYTNTWKEAAKQREAIRTAQSSSERKRDVQEVVQRAIQN